MKLCTDCKHCSLVASPDERAKFQADGNAEFAKCLAPQNSAPDLVTGFSKRLLTYCDSQRLSELGCGAEGKWYVESWFPPRYSKDDPQMHDLGDPPHKDEFAAYCRDLGVEPYGPL